MSARAKCMPMRLPPLSAVQASEYYVTGGYICLREGCMYADANSFPIGGPDLAIYVTRGHICLQVGGTRATMNLRCGCYRLHVKVLGRINRLRARAAVMLAR